MPMREALTLLHALYPAQGWVYVGAGDGDFLDQVVSQPPVPTLLAIEADEAFYTQLAAKIEQHPQAQALHLLVSGKDEAASFYRHSNPKENGLLSAALLTPLWKNLRLREAITTPAQTLHNILASAGEGGPRYNWLTLACLPALPLLQGLGPTLQQFDVLQARVALTDDAALAEAGASRPAVDAWLQMQGFKPLLVQEETHAQLASVFYARDWKTQAVQTSQALTLAHQRKIEAFQQEKAALTQACDVQSKLATKRQAQIEALDKEKAELVAARDALNQEKTTLTQARDTQSKLATERQAKIEALDKEKAELLIARDALNQEKAALTQARDTQIKLATERQAQLEALGKEKAELVAVRDALSQEKAALTQARDAQSQLAAERQAKIVALDKAKAELIAVRDALSQEKAALTQARDVQSQLVAEHQAKIVALDKEKAELVAVCDALSQEKIVLAQARDAQLTSSKPPQKFSSDADIDEFIKDITPFFLNRSIVYVDVGAYIGEVFTKLLASKKFKLREAHLIEPNPESYRKLQDAAKASKMQSCNTYHIGISNHPGIAKFKAAQSMTKRVRVNISSENSSNIFETECRKLDEIAELFTDKRTHLMKLDVEGEELDALKSAENLLKDQRIDVLYVEVGLNLSGTQQTYFGNIDTMLQSYGYRVFKIYEQKNEWIDDSPLLRRCNVAYMSSKFASLHSYSKILKESTQ